MDGLSPLKLNAGTCERGNIQKAERMGHPSSWSFRQPLSGGAHRVGCRESCQGEWSQNSGSPDDTVSFSWSKPYTSIPLDFTFLPKLLFLRNSPFYLSYFELAFLALATRGILTNTRPWSLPHQMSLFYRGRVCKMTFFNTQLVFQINILPHFLLSLLRTGTGTDCPSAWVGS